MGAKNVIVPRASGSLREALPAGIPSGMAVSPGVIASPSWSGAKLLLLLSAALFVLNLVLNFPGNMNNDAVSQYAEAISGQYSDWHPPVMAWLWSVLRLVGNGPAPFLIVHLAIYWAGFALFADATRRLGHPHLAIVIALAGAFPPFIYTNADVTKDVGMAAVWLAATGLIYWFRSQGRKMPFGWSVVAIALMLYGALVRTNAVFALGPLVLFAFAPGRWLRSGRLMLASLIVALVALPASQVLNRQLFNPEAKHAINSLFLFDLMGMAAHERDPSLLLPRATLTESDLKNCYTPYWWDSLSPWGHCAQRVNRPDANEVVYSKGLALQWALTIAEHPLAYAVHRLKHFNSALLFAVPLKHIRLTPEYQKGDPAFTAIGSFTPREIRFDILKKSPLIWPATWLVWGGFLLVFASRQPASSPTLLARILIVSALAYSSAYLLIGVATDMRYHFWSLLSLLIATLVLMPQIWPGLRARSATLMTGLAAVALVMLIGTATRLLDVQAFVH